MSSPKVSINLCCYDGEKYLEETLQSIFRQTYKNWELVVINDGSTDSTADIIQKHVADGWPIHYHYQRNAGIGRARNKALQLSSGEYVAFIDQDDIWLASKLEKQVPLFDHENVGLVFSDAIYFNHHGKESRLYRNRQVPTGYVFRDLLSSYWLCLSTVVISRRSLDGLADWFDAQFEIIEEADLFCRIAYTWECQYVAEPLVKYRVHDTSVSWARMGLAPEEWARMIQKCSRLFPDFERRFSSELSLLRESIQYEHAKCELLKGNTKDARRRLLPILFRDVRYGALYFLTFSPQKALHSLLSLKKVMPAREGLDRSH